MFYERFISLCQVRGVSPSHVMKEININRANASFWKKGSMPSSENLQKLALYFKVPVEYLLGTNDSLTVDVRDPDALRETISKAEIEKDRLFLGGLVEQLDTLPENYRAEAIQDMTTFAQYVLDKYRAMVPEDSFIGP